MTDPIPLKVTVVKQYVIDGQVILDEHAQRLLSLPDATITIEGAYDKQVTELKDMVELVRAVDGQPVCICTPNDVCYSCYSARREPDTSGAAPTDSQVADYIRRNPEWFERWVAKQNRIHGGPRW